MDLKIPEEDTNENIEFSRNEKEFEIPEEEPEIISAPRPQNRFVPNYHLSKDERKKRNREQRHQRGGHGNNRSGSSDSSWRRRLVDSGFFDENDRSSTSRLSSFNKYDKKANDSPSGELSDDEFDYRKGCIICRCNFKKNDSTFTLRCSHTFHTDEIKMWLKNNDTCPICTYSVGTGTPGERTPPLTFLRDQLHNNDSDYEDMFGDFYADKPNAPLKSERGYYARQDEEFDDIYDDFENVYDKYGRSDECEDWFQNENMTDGESPERDIYLPPSPDIYEDIPAFDNKNILNDMNLEEVITFMCRIRSVRDQKKMMFLILKYDIPSKRESHKIQAIIFKKSLPEEKLAVLQQLTAESIVMIKGKLAKSPVTIKSEEVTYHDREIHVEDIEIVSRSSHLPVTLSDLSTPLTISSEEEKKREKEGIEVGQDTRLNHRVLDLRTQQKQAIFQLQSYMSQYMRECLYENNFMEIHTPKLIGASSEGGAEVFRFDYFGTPAFLAQSPQLYKQMVINSDFPRIFEVGPVFRAEKSNTKRHLTEFTGFDIEMRIENNYEEILDMFYDLLATTFSKLYSKHGQLIAQATQKDENEFTLQLKKCILSYPDAIKLLNRNLSEGEDAIGMYDDLSHAQEFKLGQLVKKIFHTDLFVLDKFPMNIRPFYTMADPDTRPTPDSSTLPETSGRLDLYPTATATAPANSPVTTTAPLSENWEDLSTQKDDDGENKNDNLYSKSYDIIFRGQEVLSGAQRVHDYDTLVRMAHEKGFSQESIDSMNFYFDSFRYGSYPHGGGGFGLERLLANFLGLDEIRMVSMFPRDPKRIKP